MDEQMFRKLHARLADQEAALAVLQRRVAARSAVGHRIRAAYLIPSLLIAVLVAFVPLSLLAAGPFTDLDPASPHNTDIEAIYAAGLTTGCNPPALDHYCPKDMVTREQMASFLARTAGLGGNPPVANAATLGGHPVEAFAQVGSSPTFANLTVDGAISSMFAPGTANRVTPLAYGYVTTTGDLGFGTPNVSVSFNAALVQYEIAIAGESYSVATNLAFVTPASTNPRLVTQSSATGRLVVIFFDLSGARVPENFSFLVYKP